MGYTLRQIVGALVLDAPIFEWRLRTAWTRIRNRRERVEYSEDGRGVACKWQWTSDLHAPKVFPRLGTRLMARCIRDWPVDFAAAPKQGGQEVQVSFVIGHRGRDRIPLLLATLATIAAQRGVTCECIVVEQSGQSEVADLLPAWVRYIHTGFPDPGMPYCRSWALNVGARVARGRLLVLHDNDMLVPRDYAAELWARSLEGYEAINLKRFVFYLSERHSRSISAGDKDFSSYPPEVIVQNAEAGGSIAVTSAAFFEIGGFDESFVGWGGEDNEFWQRALTRKTWPYGYLPIVHLWHASQPEKIGAKPFAAEKLHALSAIPPQRRIAGLRQRTFGDSRSMDPPWFGAKS